jgi:hypothetical protein
MLQKYLTVANSSYSKELKVYVGRKAPFSTWLEFFPRSAAEEHGKHGTFQDCNLLIPKMSEMGFDEVFRQPINPNGEKNRKVKKNTTKNEPTDSGVTCTIGIRDSFDYKKDKYSPRNFKLTRKDIELITQQFKSGSFVTDYEKMNIKSIGLPFEVGMI